jgi:hypothetical protein
VTSAFTVRALSGLWELRCFDALFSGVEMPKYRVLQGIDFPPDRRVEAGAIVDDLPPKAIKWLREQGLIELEDANSTDEFTPVKDVVASKKTPDVVADVVLEETVEI